MNAALPYPAPAPPDKLRADVERDLLARTTALDYTAEWFARLCLDVRRCALPPLQMADLADAMRERQRS
jgi:hypothetical protein